MATLHITEPRALVRKEGDTLAVDLPASPDGSKERRTVRIPLMKVTQVVVHGDGTVTSPALAALLENQVEVCFLTQDGRFRGRLSPAFSKNGLLRIEQHKAHNSRERSFRLARAFVAGKLTNMRTLLLRFHRRREDPDLETAAQSLKGILERVSDLTLPEVTEAVEPGQEEETDRGELLGLEGAGSGAYFGVFGKLLAEGWMFERRSRRPPSDPVNALLSFAYTLLLHQVSAAVNVVGLDPYVGFLHSPRYGRPALALDLMEEFRPVVADSVVLGFINNRMVAPDEFLEELGGYRLNDDARRRFLTVFEDRLEEEIQHPVFGYKASYRRCLELQARLLAKAITGEIPEYRPFQVR